MKVAFLYDAKVNYFFFKNSSTASGAIIDSTNVYAPVLGDFTIFQSFELISDVLTWSKFYYYFKILIMTMKKDESKETKNNDKSEMIQFELF